MRPPESPAKVPQENESITEPSTLAHKAYYCAIKINGRNAIALPDSGSDVSIISKRTTDALKLEFKECHGKLMPFNSEPFDIIGSIELVITIGHLNLKCAFFIIGNYDESVLLGCNVLALNNLDMPYS